MDLVDYAIKQLVDDKADHAFIRSCLTPDTDLFEFYNALALRIASKTKKWGQSSIKSNIKRVQGTENQWSLTLLIPEDAKIDWQDGKPRWLQPGGFRHDKAIFAVARIRGRHTADNGFSHTGR